MTMGLLLVVLAALACGSTAHSAGDEGPEVRGTYVNYQYCYTVTLPADLVAHKNYPPMPDHGIGMRVLDASAYLWVDGSYDSLFWGSSATAADEMLTWHPERRIVFRQHTTLGGLPAIRTVVRYTGDRGLVMVEECIVAYRPPRTKDGAGVVYTVALDVPETRWQQARKSLDAIVASFRLRRSAE